MVFQSVARKAWSSDNKMVAMTVGMKGSHKDLMLDMIMGAVMAVKLVLK